MATTKIKDHYFEYENMKYFRDNASALKLGTYGEKKDPVGTKSYVDPHANVQAEYLTSEVVTGPIIATIAWSETNKNDFEINGNVKYFGIKGELHLDGSYEKARDANLVLARFLIIGNQLEKLLNTKASGAKKYLAEEGNDTRIVTNVWIAMEGTLGETVSNATSVTIGAAKSGTDVEISFGNSKTGTTRITLSPGTTFAYALHKVKNWTDHKSTVEKVEVDYYGMS